MYNKTWKKNSIYFGFAGWFNRHLHTDDLSSRPDLTDGERNNSWELFSDFHNPSWHVGTHPYPYLQNKEENFKNEGKRQKWVWDFIPWSELLFRVRMSVLSFALLSVTTIVKRNCEKRFKACLLGNKAKKVGSKIPSSPSSSHFYSHRLPFSLFLLIPLWEQCF